MVANAYCQLCVEFKASITFLWQHKPTRKLKGKTHCHLLCPGKLGMMAVPVIPALR